MNAESIFEFQETVRDAVTSRREKIGCAYCGSPRFKAVRIQPIENSKYVDCVNYCPDCEREDWCAVNPNDLAIVAAILSVGV